MRATTATTNIFDNSNNNYKYFLDNSNNNNKYFLDNSNSNNKYFLQQKQQQQIFFQTLLLFNKKIYRVQLCHIKTNLIHCTYYSNKPSYEHLHDYSDY